MYTSTYPPKTDATEAELFKVIDFLNEKHNVKQHLFEGGIGRRLRCMATSYTCSAPDCSRRASSWSIDKKKQAPKCVAHGVGSLFMEDRLEDYVCELRSSRY